jgi:hypothetical protein
MDASTSMDAALSDAAAMQKPPDASPAAMCEAPAFGTELEQDAGMLSCDERVALASDLVSDATNSSSACQRDSDCVDVGNSTGCHAGCGRLVSRTCAQAVKDLIARIDESLCARFESECYPLDVPPCPPPPPQGLMRCVNGQCDY